MLTLQESSLDWAIRHALRYGDTDVFPVPFEYQAIEFDWDNIKAHLAGQNVLTWATHPHRTLLSPKAKYGFRAITQLDPLDFLLFSATVKEVAEDLETKRVAVTDNRVFSYRVQVNAEGQLFDPNTGYRAFLAECQRKLDRSSGIRVVGTADISDFYSRIYHHRLENALQSATGRASHIKALMHLLSGWNGTETFGIPIGGAPSRILAEITLSDVDEALLASNIDFVRFNDDYRIFASSHAAAYRHIVFLAETLFRNHGLSLQPQKTTILEKDSFRAKLHHISALVHVPRGSHWIFPSYR
jgi:reverse transcriptase-like protein